MPGNWQGLHNRQLFLFFFKNLKKTLLVDPKQTVYEGEQWADHFHVTKVICGIKNRNTIIISGYYSSLDKIHYGRTPPWMGAH